MAGHREAPVGPPPVELRRVTADGWELWRALRLEALAEAPYAFSSKLADWATAPEARWRARLGQPDDRNLVALVEGQPVGMASGIPGDEASTVELVSMWVRPTARGHGVADALLHAVEHWGLVRGASRLCLGVVASNQRARRLYERHGLVVTGEVERSSPTEPVELMMCKSLLAPR
jgi:GNAT superfamily N-acetyltransferase